MRGLEDEVSDDDLHIELFMNFTAQRHRVRLAIPNFTAREFPETREVHAVLPPCNEKPILPLDDGGDDEDSIHCVGL